MDFQFHFFFNNLDFILLYGIDLLMTSQYFECRNWLNLYWYLHIWPPKNVK